jgi:hypothetical protein
MRNILIVLCLSIICCNNTKVEVATKDYKSNNVDALKYCKEKGFNEDYYFLLDLSIRSGKNRFFIYNFKENKISDQNLVTHGSCDQFEENTNKWEAAKFSTKTDSHCSMKGKYKIGKRDYSSWGINVKYWLHGLEKTNETAVKRVVVLHSWNAVSNEEIYPKVSPLSWGCPAVSDAFMKKLDTKLKLTKKPVLLWIIE